MPTTFGTNIDAKHDAYPPAPTYTLIVSLILTGLWQVRIRAEGYLRHATVSEYYHDHCSAELGECVLHNIAGAVPPEMLVVVIIEFGLVDLFSVVHSACAFIVGFVGCRCIGPIKIGVVHVGFVSVVLVLVG